MSTSITSASPSTEPLKVIGWFYTLWEGRKIILRSILLSGLLGLIVALLSGNEYQSWTTVVPQTSNPANKLGGISSLAAMAGFNLNMSGGEELSPAVYPQIMGSVLYQIELMNSEFQIEGSDKPVNLYTYYRDYAKMGFFYNTGEFIKGLPGQLTGLFAGRNIRKDREAGSPIAITREQEKIRKLIEKQVTLNVDVKNGYITLYAAFPEAELSAEVADRARELLQKYITEFKIKKASDQLSFIEGRYDEKKTEFLTLQRNLALYRDQHKNISTAIAGTEEERLKSEYSIALNVYNELAKQLEQAKIQVKEDTPVFSVIQPAKVPLEKSKPKKVLILTLWLFLGALAGAGILFGRQMQEEWSLEKKS